MPWAGLSIRSEAIGPCGDIGNWSVVPSAFVGTTIIIFPLTSLGFLITPLARWEPSPNRIPRPVGKLGKKRSEPMVHRPLLCWPQALRQVRAWLEPWVMLQRYWRAWSALPPPLPLQQLLDALCIGLPLFLYNSSSPLSTKYRYEVVPKPKPVPKKSTSTS